MKFILLYTKNLLPTNLHHIELAILPSDLSSYKEPVHTPACKNKIGRGNLVFARTPTGMEVTAIP